MIIDQYLLPTLGINDLIIIAFIEISFIWFFFPKEYVGKVMTLVGSVNLIKVGVMTLIYPIIPNLTTTINQILLVEVTALFLIGIVVSTFIYENERWAPSREQAGAMAFRMTSISSLVWVTYKSLQPQIAIPMFNTYSAMTSLVPENVLRSTDTGSAFPFPLQSLGFVLVAIGIMVIYYRYKQLSSPERQIPNES